MNCFTVQAAWGVSETCFKVILLLIKKCRQSFTGMRLHATPVLPRASKYGPAWSMDVIAVSEQGLKLNFRQTAKYADEMHIRTLFYLSNNLYFCTSSSLVYTTVPERTVLLDRKRRTYLFQLQFTFTYRSTFHSANKQLMENSTVISSSLCHSVYPS